MAANHASRKGHACYGFIVFWRYNLGLPAMSNHHYRGGKCETHGRFDCLADQRNGRSGGKYLKKNDWYYYLMSSDALRGSKVVVDGREMLMFASYSYLDLIHHPRLTPQPKLPIDAYSSGTHGVRLLAGTTELHDELEATIATFKKTDAAVTYSSGFVTNMAAISALTGRHDVVFSDRLNHASIVDGCQLSLAKFVRFRHNDMADLERKLAAADCKAGKLVVTDAVFSMDGDVIDLPGIHALCEQYGAWLMVDEAHSLGVLGETGTRHRRAFWDGRRDRRQNGHPVQDHPQRGRIHCRRR